ncbi:MAG: CRTAC1 family protein [Rhodopirellula sp.]|nr:CRTAC1 family protein [Rhodopirellula sp.]
MASPHHYSSLKFLSSTSILGLSILLSLLCNGSESGEVSLQFEDVSKQAGINFQHYSPLTPERHLHLFMGSGAAWLDYDRDGWPDLYFGQGQAWNDDGQKSPPSNRFLSNTGDGTFRDVTVNANLVNVDYSMGVAVGDFDNDGFADIYVSSYGLNRLYHNNGDGSFSEIATSRRLDDDRFGASCTWADIDGDGNLGLFVTNYLKLDKNDYPLCRRSESGHTYYSGCHPRYQKHEYDILFRNKGDGTFADISKDAGLLSEPARCGLGVVATDLDNDGDVDFYVANDTVHNQLWINDGHGKFTDEALLTGVAVNRIGIAEAGMGVATGDVDGDGLSDLFVTNYFNESNTLYRNEGFAFTDVTSEYGLAAPSQMRLAFGASLFDIDNDGWLDLFVANGHVNTDHQDPGRNEPFAQLPQLFHNQNGRRFRDVSAQGGDYFKRHLVGRASCVADFDRDGRLDLAVQHLNGPASLLRNNTTPTGHVVQLELVGTKSARDGNNAVVRVVVGGRQIMRAVVGSSSYLSSSDIRLVIGIGEYEIADSIEVRWPGGRRESWRSVPTASVQRLIEGTGSSDD